MVEIDPVARATLEDFADRAARRAAAGGSIDEDARRELLAHAYDEAAARAQEAGRTLIAPQDVDAVLDRLEGPPAQAFFRTAPAPPAPPAPPTVALLREPPVIIGFVGLLLSASLLLETGSLFVGWIVLAQTAAVVLAIRRHSRILLGAGAVAIVLFLAQAWRASDPTMVFYTLLGLQWLWMGSFTYAQGRQAFQWLLPARSRPWTRRDTAALVLVLVALVVTVAGTVHEHLAPRPCWPTFEDDTTCLEALPNAPNAPTLVVIGALALVGTWLRAPIASAAAAGILVFGYFFFGTVVGLLMVLSGGLVVAAAVVQGLFTPPPVPASPETDA